MDKFSKFLLLSVFGFALFGFQTGSRCDLTVKFPQLEDQEGKIFIKLLDKNEELVDRAIVNVKRGVPQYTFMKLKAGSYAIVAFQDLNGNKDIDKGFFGQPTEPYGFSNNVRGTFGPPSFEKQLFTLSGNKIIEVILD
ncbi:DUF2141 domain-containing protein [Salibacter halophilus]|uniref:DUF2141 domain-containing protein n=1 Tax=Salibacter halophilus TaxID=1803916 RepID=A0A6N6MBX9_9FLAO|nr:DUF2141 domain-containing protein [Salibacter halophilus]KAB1066057.1 DUF2141 domain-containing protein [Salibacter halophilus]